MREADQRLDRNQQKDVPVAAQLSQVKTQAMLDQHQKEWEQKSKELDQTKKEIQDQARALERAFEELRKEQEIFRQERSRVDRERSDKQRGHHSCSEGRPPKYSQKGRGYDQGECSLKEVYSAPPSGNIQGQYPPPPGSQYSTRVAIYLCVYTLRFLRKHKF